MHFQEVRGMNWIDLVWIGDRCWALADTVTGLRVIQNAGNLLTGYEPVSFLRRTPLHAASKIK